MLPRKNLHLYLIHEHDQFKLRALEIYPITTSTSLSEEEMLNLMSIEIPFSNLLSESLSMLGRQRQPNVNEIQHYVLQRLSQTNTKEVIDDYAYRDLVCLLYADASMGNNDYPGSKQDLSLVLGAIDEAIEAFKRHAINDGYDVTVTVAAQLPDFSNKIDILLDSLKQEPSSSHPGLSQFITWWLDIELNQGITATNAESRGQLLASLIKPLLSGEKIYRGDPKSSSLQDFSIFEPVTIGSAIKLLPEDNAKYISSANLVNL